MGVSPLPSRDSEARVSAVTFDFGQTLGELDTAFLARRLVERGLTPSAEVAVATALERATAAAWAAYDQAIRAGEGGHPWKQLMTSMLGDAFSAVSADPLRSRVPALVDWLWSEQPKQNLWRRPIKPMFDLVRALRAANIPVGVLSNSEGRLRELAEEMGVAALFDTIVDSGREGIEKPNPEIFRRAAERLGTDVSRLVHIGDAPAADVEGAVAAGARAIWFTGTEATRRMEPPEVLKSDRAARAATAGEVRHALESWGVVGPSGPSPAS